MVLRVIAIVLALLALERVADACCVGCACTKYRQRLHDFDDDVPVTEPVYGYTHSVTGALPRWSAARIAKFLASGTWKPITASSLPKDAVVARLAPSMRVLPAPSIQFMTADKVGKTTVTNTVLIRRIEKQGRAILVEVDDRTFKLAPCLRKRDTVCLVDPGTLTLAPLPPPGDAPAPNDGFAKPPAP
jgi:hypothetical protein